MKIGKENIEVETMDMEFGKMERSKKYEQENQRA